MACLVIGNCFLFTYRDDLAFPLQTAYYPVDCIEEVLPLNDIFIFSCRDKCSFIAYVSNISTREARSLFGQESDIKSLFEFYRTKMNLEYSLPFSEFG